MPAPSLTGYALTNHFRKLRLREAFSPLEAYLFFELVAICNEESWPAEFNATNGVLQAGLGCSEQGLINARLRLEKAGLIAFVSGTRRTPTRYRFTAEGSTQFSHSSGDSLKNGAAANSVKSTESKNSLTDSPGNGSTHFSQPPADGSTDLSHSTPEKEGNGSSEGSTQFSHSAFEKANGSTQGSSEGSSELSPYKEQTKTKRKEVEEKAADAATPTCPTSLLPTEKTVGKKGRKAAATPAELAALVLPHAGPEFAELWATFRDGPKQAGKPLTALVSLLKKLGKYPEGFAVKMLERAIECNWSGLEYDHTPAAFLAWQTQQAGQPVPAPTPLPTPELNHAFLAEQAEQEAERFQAHLARHALAA